MALRRALILSLLLGWAPGCAARHGWTDGVASWYGPGYRGKPTASGETFRPGRRTAAHRELPFGTVLRVTRGDRSVRVVVNDRGPFVQGRDLDLSQRAARRLGMIDAGVSPVRYRAVGCKRRFAGPRGCAR